MKQKNISKNRIKLDLRYNQLMEQAYNLRQTDHAMSDVSEFRALKTLNKLNRLEFLARGESSQPIS
ncbi:type VI secretion system baseplate subunit TssK [Bizionia gelidisalsuginis]|uniref:Type VI secretion system baseplate subunit TssK n=2 Tax=Bizionia TaxID=283785 RepID=A0A8H2QN32_9FLAO|nr:MULTISPECIES: Lacal_2735 family protein [Bizionia]TYB80314.1 type VI secretion system baseplate subunit TssK [Bizionia saleffrena]TYC17157.1 type VI secretion system baseplate subunit TssK [Bizionia gelidisalsuginis]